MKLTPEERARVEEHRRNTAGHSTLVKILDRYFPPPPRSLEEILADETDAQIAARLEGMCWEPFAKEAELLRLEAVWRLRKRREP